MARWSSALRGGGKESGGGANGRGGEEIAAIAYSAAVAAVEKGGGEERRPPVSGENRPAAGGEEHPYDFRVCGPRNLSPPNWRDIFNSSWKDPKYKRMAIACFIQGVYLMELDRQEKKKRAAAVAAEAVAEEVGGGSAGELAPRWWRPFKYKLAETLVDERDGSIYGAVLEWDRAAALSDGATIRRDLEDDLRFLAWESLRGSARFGGALHAVAAAAERHGGAAVCVAGHSLGAALALQCHLFNPPSISMAASFKSFGEKAAAAWKRLRGGDDGDGDGAAAAAAAGEGDAAAAAKKEKNRWAPHLYVNNSDYICCYYYADRPSVAGEEQEEEEEEKDESGGGGVGGVGGAAGGRKEGAAAAAKLFVAAKKGPQKFLEAHGLQQWWSDDMELQLVPGNRSKLIDRQLRSLYTATAAGAALPQRLP
ncbi:unnamed protein product [Spirodela intermedia]|uniref:Uncharacterized protein n=1 Tax=Spirodela intermedia TaxID=51605 RepID=A0A7I8J5H5_SPIIN|nr:unnamed protein product [Spirodela intermedia]CAA6665280.1 unnamed protein product [Spirodela intermedia]